MMADADGATTFSEIEKLDAQYEAGADVIVGSRNHLKENAVAQVGDVDDDLKGSAHGTETF